MQGPEIMRVETEVMIGEKIGAGYGAIGPRELGPEEASELVAEVRERLATVDPDAPSCCFDGRNCVHLLSGNRTQPRPSVGGGALITAYAAAEMIGWFGDDSGSIVERLQRLDRVLRANGINPGNHVDQTALGQNYIDPESGKPKTGCGADDRFLDNVGHVYEDRTAVSGFMETTLHEDASLLPNGNGQDVRARNAAWNSTDALGVLTAESEDTIEVLATEHTPTHGHKELLAVFNYIENTTVDRDSLVAETGQQVFGIDMWYIGRIAKALATGPEAATQERALYQAMTAYQIGVYLTLCNGSQRPVVLK